MILVRIVPKGFLTRDQLDGLLSAGFILIRGHHVIGIFVEETEA